MAVAIKITAEDILPNIECHFKVSAGPGAGKTRWLVNHLQHVSRKSLRLFNTRKIACITFTNVAAETIITRLGLQADRVEVATIHSFLYKHLVKPFAFLIPSDYGLDIAKLDGHDDIPVYKGILHEWKKETNQGHLTDDEKVANALGDLGWQIDNNGEIILRPRKLFLGRITNTVSIRNASYIEYKKLCWKRGLIHHDDILFFSNIIIRQNDRVLNAIRAKFPYFFIDEFQDTNPLQTEIIKKIALEETVVGVIGDVAQSIYDFQGAKPEQFAHFALPNLVEYFISDNHRSTDKIITVLNSIRTDIKQVGMRNIEGTNPTILIGSKVWALNKAEELAGGEVYSLSRDNITSNMMRDKLNIVVNNKVGIEELRNADSNSGRVGTIIASIKAIESARQNRYKESIKELTKALKKLGVNPDETQKLSLLILKSLINDYNKYKSAKLIDLYTAVSSLLPVKLASFKAGSIKTFYETHSYESIALTVNVKEDNGYHRTIHKAKGAEFKNVLVVLDKTNKGGQFEEERELNFLLKPDLSTEEEHRIKYVAVSRAEDNLFLCVPSLSADLRDKLKDFTLIQE